MELRVWLVLTTSASRTMDYAAPEIVKSLNLRDNGPV